MENEGIVHSTIISSAPLALTLILHFPFSIFNYKMGPDPSSFSLVMDLITTV